MEIQTKIQDDRGSCRQAIFPGGSRQSCVSLAGLAQRGRFPWVLPGPPFTHPGADRCVGLPDSLLGWTIFLASGIIYRKG
ncbi:hypothetical protein ES703_69024 [subsurface metagenome]